MPIAAAIGAVASSALSSRAARKGAKQAAQSQRDSLAQQKYFYDTTRDDLSPWRETGSDAVRTMGNLFIPRKPATNIEGGQILQGGRDLQIQPANVPGEEVATEDGRYDDFYKSPGYQFRLDEGLKVVNRAASARGVSKGGRTLKELNRYASDYASKEFGTYVDRLSGLATLGQNAAAQTGTIGADLAKTSASSYKNLGDAYTAAGDRQAAGYIGVGNTLGSAFSYLNKQGGGTEYLST